MRALGWRIRWKGMGECERGSSDGTVGSDLYVSKLEKWGGSCIPWRFRYENEWVENLEE